MSQVGQYLIGSKGTYKVEQFLGKGASGTVTRCMDIKTRVEYAIKKVSLQNQAEGHLVQQLTQYTFKNVVQYYEVFQNDIESFYIVMEYCNCYSLHEQIYVRNMKLNVKEAASIALQVANGILELNGVNIMHRDIKPQNIVSIQKGPSIVDLIYKICDFGLSKQANLTTTTVIGTTYYMAPELAQGKVGQQYSFKVDIWSLGMVFYELLLRLRYFQGQDYQNILTKITSYRQLTQQKTLGFRNDVRQLLLGMIEEDPNKRFPIQEVIKRLQQIIVTDQPLIVNQMEADKGRQFNQQTSNQTEVSYGFLQGQYIRSIGKVYQMIKPMCTGGTVMECQDLANKKTYAIKQVEMIQENQEGSLVRSLLNVPFENVVRFYDVFLTQDDPNSFYILMEYCDCSLLDQIQDFNKTFSEPEAIDIIFQAANGLKELKDKGVIHRDIKPGNIMVIQNSSSTSKLKYKIVDLGISKKAESTQTRSVGTRSYMAPELFSNDQILYGSEVDVWALGLVLYELLTKNAYFEGIPFQAQQQIMQFQGVQNEKLNPFSDSLKTLLSGMVQRDISKRFTLEEVIERCKVKKPKIKITVLNNQGILPQYTLTPSNNESLAINQTLQQKFSQEFVEQQQAQIKEIQQQQEIEKQTLESLKQQVEDQKKYLSEAQLQIRVSQIEIDQYTLTISNNESLAINQTLQQNLQQEFVEQQQAQIKEFQQQQEIEKQTLESLKQQVEDQKKYLSEAQLQIRVSQIEIEKYKQQKEQFEEETKSYSYGQIQSCSSRQQTQYRKQSYDFLQKRQLPQYNQQTIQPKQNVQQPKEQPKQNQQQPKEQPKQNVQQPKEQPKQNVQKPKEGGCGNIIFLILQTQVVM